jgi:hypothetical protein
VSYEKIGDVLKAQGKLQEATNDYQQELAITEQLVERDKSNVGWQRTGLELAESYAGADRESLINALQNALDGSNQ